VRFEDVKPQMRRAKVLLIGEAGSGKTHAALTFPNPAVIDAEGSVDWFADRFKFKAVATKSYSDVRDLIRSVREGHVPCETVVIDSLTTIYNGLINAASAQRDDLRPLEGLLQGTYAHLAVTGFWRTRQEVTVGADSEAAAQRFAYWHAHTRDAIETLTNSGSLTSLGKQFVIQMRQSLSS